MRQFNGTVQIVGEMAWIVVLALTGRFIGFAQTTLESGVPLTVERALSHFTNILSVFTQPSYAGLLLSVLAGASLIRIGIAYANRAAIGEEDLTWGQRTVRLPVAARVSNPQRPGHVSSERSLWRSASDCSIRSIRSVLGARANVQSLAGGLTSVGALLLLFALHGVALAIIGYIASPAVLTIEEMAGGCREPRRRSDPPRAASV